MATVVRENVAPLTDKLTVKLSKDDYYPAFEKALKNYSKRASIPGFRPGMVPMGHVKKMYGSSVYTDEVLRLVEKEINGYLETEKPEIFGQPLPTEDNNTTVRQLNMDLPGDYQFSFEIGLKPQVSVANLQTAVINRSVIDVTDEMVQAEVERLQNRHGNLNDIEAVADDSNVLNVNFTETDANGEALEEGISKEINLLVKYFAEGFRPKLQGMKVGDSANISLAEAFADKEREWVLSDLGLKAGDEDDRNFKITLTKIGELEKRALDAEFFAQLFPGKSIATEDEFRSELKADLEAHWQNQARTQVHDNIYHYLVDNTEISFPEDFLRRWIKSGGEKAKSDEEVEQEFPAFLKSLRWSMISDELLKQSGIEVEPEELRQFARRQMMGYMGGGDGADAPWLDSYVDRMLQDKKYVDQMYNQVLTDKLFRWAETQVANYNDQHVTAEAFAEQQHEHKH